MDTDLLWSRIEERAAVMAIVASAILDEGGTFPVRFNRALKMVAENEIELTVREWIQVLRGLGIYDFNQYFGLIGNVRVPGGTLPYYDKFDREMSAIDWHGF
ncbi:hypothetical protein HGA91_06430 [candidate division WWE3 bacterium]|nr:hypothetical protein [candidate division WWE3 bacterium]